MGPRVLVAARLCRVELTPHEIIIGSIQKNASRVTFVNCYITTFDLPFHNLT